MPSIVIPTYNEKYSLPKLVKEILSQCKGIKIEILIVDDNSPDGTGRIADEIKRRHKNIRVLHRKEKTGLGSAIIDGFRQCNTEIIGVMDADLSHPPSLIPKMLDEIKKTDMVIASRYTKGGGIDASWSFFRQIISKGAILLIGPLVNIKDPMSGFFFVRKRLINEKNIEPSSCKICLEILVKGNIKNFVEVPYTFINRKKGRSKIMSQKEITNYLRHVIKLYLHKIR